MVQSFDPPSTRSVSPVIQLALSEARKVTAPAISSGCATRFKRLQAQRVVAAFVGLREARHVGRDDAGRDGVHAHAALAERGSEVPHERIDCALRRCVRRQFANRRARRQRRKQHDAAASAQHRQKLLHEEERRAHVDGEEVVEIFDGRVFDTRGFRDARVRDEHVQPSADHGAHAGWRAYADRRRCADRRRSFCACPPLATISATVESAAASLLL